MITKSKFRQEAGILPEQEDDLDWLLDMVITLWEDTTKRLWNERTDFVDTYTRPRGARPTIIFLRLWPVTALTQVEVRRTDEADWTVLDPTDYRLMGNRRLLRLGGELWPGETRVTMTAGYSEAPQDVQKALVLQAKFMMSRMGEEKIVVKSQNFEGGSGVLEAQNLHPFFKMLAKSLKRKA